MCYEMKLLEFKDDFSTVEVIGSKREKELEGIN